MSYSFVTSAVVSSSARSNSRLPVHKVSLPGDVVRLPRWSEMTARIFENLEVAERWDRDLTTSIFDEDAGQSQSSCGKTDPSPHNELLEMQGFIRWIKTWIPPCCSTSPKLMDTVVVSRFVNFRGCRKWTCRLITRKRSHFSGEIRCYHLNIVHESIWIGLLLFDYGGLEKEK